MLVTVLVFLIGKERVFLAAMEFPELPKPGAPVSFGSDKDAVLGVVSDSADDTYPFPSISVKDLMGWDSPADANPVLETASSALAEKIAMTLKKQGFQELPKPKK